MTAAAVLAWAGQSPELQFVLIVLGTFILEDAATVLAAITVAEGGVSIPLALSALYAGIVLGDIGLYALGRLSSHIVQLERFVPGHKRLRGREWLKGRVFSVVFISRFIPGARLPTYTACGFLRADLRQFILAAVVATLIWTSLLFEVALHVGNLLLPYLGAWRWVGAIGFVIVVILIGRTAARFGESTP